MASWEAHHGRDHVEGGDWRYYQRWLASLERLVVEKGLVSRDEAVRRMGELEHEDDHDHHHHDQGGGS